MFYDLVTRYHISVDQFFFPDEKAEKSSQRRQLDSLIDGMNSRELTIMTATAKGIVESKDQETED